MQNGSMSGSGFIRVSVSTARGALPVRDARVLIYGADPANDNTGVLYSLQTDEDGRTEAAALPAPSRALSMQPGSAIPFARYNITVHRDGYGSVQNIGVPVFDGIVSTQPVNLIPLSEFEESRDEEIVETQAGQQPLL